MQNSFLQITIGERLGNKLINEQLKSKIDSIIPVAIKVNGELSSFIKKRVNERLCHINLMAKDLNIEAIPVDFIFNDDIGIDKKYCFDYVFVRTKTKIKNNQLVLSFFIASELNHRMQHIKNS